MPYTDAARNTAIGAVATAAIHISLHTADPATSGANEVSGGAYARKPTTWPAAASGSITGSQVQIDVPAGVTVTHWGLWTAASAGTFHYGGPLGAAESFGSAGTYALTPTLTAIN